ncbi:MAG: hypothetical protein OXF84_07755 [Bacteroidetes bacterium]|nr:hypothetical protein [Bacteroidota bacterium]
MHDSTREAPDGPPCIPLYSDAPFPHNIHDDMYQDHQVPIWAVETFVDPSYSGSCFHAAGFHRIGYTTERGRYAPTGATRRRKKPFAGMSFPLHGDSNWEFLLHPYIRP